MGLLSHIKSQASALVRWVQCASASHFIFTRVFDDTNVWTAPQGQASVDNDEENAAAESEAEEDQPNAATGQGGRKGRKRVSQVLSMIQYLTLRRLSSVGNVRREHADSVKILCPSQVLPKAWPQQFLLF